MIRLLLARLVAGMADRALNGLWPAAELAHLEEKAEVWEPSTVLEDPLAAAIRTETQRNPDLRVVCYLTNKTWTARRDFVLTSWQLDDDGVFRTRWTEGVSALAALMWPEFEENQNR